MSTVRRKSMGTPPRLTLLLFGAASLMGVGAYCGAAGGRRLQAATPTCARPLDLIYLLDESGSIGAANFELAKRFIADTADAFNVGLGPEQTRLGLVKFSTFATRAIALDAAASYCAFSNAVQNLSYGLGSTNTFRGLNASLAEMRRGARAPTAGVSRVILTVTDGRSNGCYPDDGTTSCCGVGCSTSGIRDMAAVARSMGVSLAVLTVGNLSDFNANEIAFLSHNASRAQFNLEGYGQILGGIVGAIRAMACNEPARLAVDVAVSSGVTLGGGNGNTTRFFQFNNVTRPIDISLGIGTNATGSASLCISYSDLNPSSQRNDGCASLARDSEVGRNATLTITAHPNAVNSSVYVVCEFTRPAAGGNGSVYAPFSLSGGTCGQVHVNLTASISGAGPISAANLTFFNVSSVISNVSGAAPRCFNCPPTLVMLAASGPNAGVCAARCLTPSEWAWPSGRRLCQLCDATCYTCAQGGGPTVCTTCPDGSVLLPAAIDPALSAYERGVAAAATGPLVGRCIGYDGCPAGAVIVPLPGSPWAEMCALPTPTPTATSTGARATPSSLATSARASTTVSTSLTSTGSVSVSASVSVAFSSSATATVSGTISTSFSPSRTTTSSASESAAVTVTPSSAGTGSRTGTVSKSATPSTSSSSTGTGSGTGTGSQTGTPSFTDTSSRTGSSSQSGTPSTTSSSAGTGSGTGTRSQTGTRSPAGTSSASAAPVRSPTSSATASPTQPVCRGLPNVMPLAGTSGTAPARSSAVAGQPGMYTAGTCASGLRAFYPGARLLYALFLGAATPLGGTLTVTTCGHTANNTVLYIGTGCPTWGIPFGCLAGNDNAAAGACGGGNAFASTVVLPAVDQIMYYLQLGGVSGAPVTSGLAWAYTPPASASASGSRSRSRSRSATPSRSRSAAGTRSRTRKPKLR